MKIRIYAPIGNWFEGTTSGQIADTLDEVDEPEAVDVHINSPGGAVFEGVGIYQVLRAYEGDVTVHIDGLAASAASVIAMAGDEIIMGEAAMMMVHNPWTIALGNAEELRDVADTLDTIRDAMIAAYRRATGLDEAELREALNDETWMTAEEAVEAGFATSVVSDDDGEQASALAQLYTHDFSKESYDVPERLREKVASAHAQKIQFAAAAMAPNQGTKVKTKKKGKQTPPQSEEADGNQQAETPDLDEDAIRAQAKREERERQKQITAAAKNAGFDTEGEFVQAMLDDDTPIEDARAKVLAKLGEQSPDPAVNAHEGITVQTDERDNFRAGVQQALTARLDPTEERDPTNEFNSFTAFEMARKAAELAGVNTGPLTKKEVVGAAFSAASLGGHTTSDFPDILVDTMHKQVLAGWEEAEETFDQWTKPGNLSDFRAAERTGVGPFDTFDKVEEDGEVTGGSMSDRKSSIQLDTYAKKIRFTRKLIINDDLGQLADSARKMGRAGRRTVGNAVTGILADNPSMYDGNNLFDSGNHNNSVSTALSFSALSAALTAMRTQQDDDGKTNLNIVPSILLVPAALEADAEVLMNSELLPGSANNDRNTMRGRFTVIVDPKLDLHSGGASKWYLLGAPMRYDGIEVGYLDGIAQPQIEQQDMWTVQGSEFMSFIDFGVAAHDWRPLYRGGV